MQVRPMETTEPLERLKRQYIQQATAPLDGMWLFGFVPRARHFGLYEDKALVGFFCVNEAGFLLQFHVDPSHQARASQLFDDLLDDPSGLAGEVAGVFVSTAEPLYLSLCLDRLAGGRFPRFEVNALMYRHPGTDSHPPQRDSLDLTMVDASQLSQAVDFAAATLGAPSEWLEGYFGNLIQRHELYGVWKDGRLVATGERRGRDEYQAEYADVGMVVAPSERGRGLATRILRQLVLLNEDRGLKSICSTERVNLAAQKAITRAGFVSSHRILQFHARGEETG